MSARNGDSTTTSSVVPAQSGHWRRSASAVSGSFVMWTAVAWSLIELAKAIAWRVARSRRATGTMTIGSRACSVPTGMRSSASACSTRR